MKLFISDIHLTDSNKSAQVDLSRLFECIENLSEKISIVDDADLEIILLGDIFEFLRSEEWINNNVRPWQGCTESHINTVFKIYQKIILNNRLFIDGFNNLLDKYPFIRINYIPGNHDRVINAEMGINARTELLKILPIEVRPDGYLFTKYIDTELGIIAKHGHEWDPLNRYTHRRAAFGDAIVIDLLMQLPIIFSNNIGISVDDPLLNFLYEIDNVRPHQPRVLAKWIQNGIDHIKKNHPSSKEAINDSFLTVADELKSLLNSKIFESSNIAKWWISFLYFISKPVAKYFGVIKAANKIPMSNEDLKAYYYHAFEDITASDSFGNDLNYIIYGHTHSPEIVPLQVDKNRQINPIYLNTGTWKNTYRLANIPSDKYPLFSVWQDECIICIYNSNEQNAGFPPFEFNRFICGLK